MDFVATARTANAPTADLLKVAFRLPNPKANTWTAEVTSVAKDYAVVALSKIDAGASTLTAEQKKQFMTSLATARGQQELQDYVTYLRSTAKIKEVVEKK